MKNSYVVKAQNVNNIDEEPVIINLFKSKRQASEYCRKENFKNEISNSCEHYYFEELRKEMLEKM